MNHSVYVCVLNGATGTFSEHPKKVAGETLFFLETIKTLWKARRTMDNVDKTEHQLVNTNGNKLV